MTPTTTPTNGVVALRTIGAVLVELPFTPAAGTYTWAASIWPAAGHPAGWGRQVWNYDPTRRGWIIPPSCTHGTVIELGAATTPRRRHPARTLTAWYGVALAHDHQWLVCTTPFDNPATAQHHATQLTDHHRHAVVERYGGPRPEAQP